MTAVKSHRPDRRPVRIRGTGDGSETSISIGSTTVRLTHEQLLDLCEDINERLKFLRSLAKVSGEKS